MMKRESLGIILNGDPDLKQKQTALLRIVDILFKYAWIVLCVGAVVAFLASFGQDSILLWKVSLCLFCWAAIFLLVSLLWSTYGRCPFCGHFFTLSRISGDKFVRQTDRTVTNYVDTYHSGVGFDSHGNSAFYTGKSTHKEYGTKSTKEYTFNSRCSCCRAVVKVKRYSFETK